MFIGISTWRVWWTESGLILSDLNRIVFLPGNRFKAFFRKSFILLALNHVGQAGIGLEQTFSFSHMGCLACFRWVLQWVLGFLGVELKTQSRSPWHRQWLPGPSINGVSLRNASFGYWGSHALPTFFNRKAKGEIVCFLQSRRWCQALKTDCREASIQMLGRCITLIQAPMLSQVFTCQGRTIVRL